MGTRQEAAAQWTPESDLNVLCTGRGDGDRSSVIKDRHIKRYALRGRFNASSRVAPQDLRTLSQHEQHAWGRAFYILVPCGTAGPMAGKKKGSMTMKKIISVILVLALSLCIGASAENRTFKVGICNYVDDASLNQIVDNIRTRLDEIGAEHGVKFEILYENCNADASVMQQIIANFIAEKADLMIGVATPVAMTMQAMTEDNGIPVVFAAVTDPVGAELVDSLEAPGANITGTSDYLDTVAVFNLMFAALPDADLIGLLYDVGQDASATPIAAAKEFLDQKGVAYREYTGTNATELMMCAQAMAADGVDAAFTPQDNTVMAAELSIYEILIENGILHFTGADSFALNGAFLGYGVDYANLGRETAEVAAEILVEGRSPAEIAVRTFDNGTATVNTETCGLLGLDYDAVTEAMTPFCTRIQPIKTAESFGEVE